MEELLEISKDIELMTMVSIGEVGGGSRERGACTLYYGFTIVFGKYKFMGNAAIGDVPETFTCEDLLTGEYIDYKEDHIRKLFSTYAELALIAFSEQFNIKKKREFNHI